jgi:hypothetical protein
VAVARTGAQPRGRQPRGRQPRGIRIDVSDGARRAAALVEAGYSSAFTVALPAAAASGNAATSPEQWARAVFEGAPRVLRWALVLGWRLVLRLRLDLVTSPERVLGWRIAGRSPGDVVLEARSALLTARKVIQVGDAHLTATTFVRFERRGGRWLWAVVAPVHHRTEPLLLTLAARRAARG